MAGQNHHFNQHVATLTYTLDRYVRETSRLYSVLNKPLANGEFIANDYYMVDLAPHGTTTRQKSVYKALTQIIIHSAQSLTVCK